jgi:hypothetical protein
MPKELNLGVLRCFGRGVQVVQLVWVGLEEVSTTPARGLKQEKLTVKSYSSCSLLHQTE